MGFCGPPLGMTLVAGGLHRVPGFADALWVGVILLMTFQVWGLVRPRGHRAGRDQRQLDDPLRRRNRRPELRHLARASRGLRFMFGIGAATPLVMGLLLYPLSAPLRRLRPNWFILLVAPAPSMRMAPFYETSPSSRICSSSARCSRSRCSCTHEGFCAGRSARRGGRLRFRSTRTRSRPRATRKATPSRCGRAWPGLRSPSRRCSC